MKRHLLILCVYPPDRVPGQRFRFEQYLDRLTAAGYSITFANLFNEQDYNIFMSHGKFLAKAWITFRALLRRIRLCASVRNYDVALIYREAFIVGPPWIEKYIARRVPCVYDFDDAIWLKDMSDHNRTFSFLKNTAKIGVIMSKCRVVVAGNPYLAEFAGKHNPEVRIIPSTIDSDKYQCTSRQSDGRVCIGWSGSGSTIRFFKQMLPVLERIKARFGDRVYFKVIADRAYKFEGIDNVACAWSSATEVEDLCELDIGIMPLTDDPWSKGKCGMKGLQYMALGIATVMSPVGVNTEIIREGVNGLLADSDEEWFEKLSRLIEDDALRKSLGEAGRKTVAESYSTNANAARWIDVFNYATGK
ncbi:MAG: glycosyltransferase family 4 protein [Flavobacteriales bacterium]|nr:glycosyltransferase family 4 protein [Flavobacteriales bacterium]